MPKRLVTLKISIALSSLIALIAISKLSIAQFQTGDTCMKVGSLPLCYILLGFTVLLVLSQIIRSQHSKLMFWIGLMVPWTVCLMTSIMHLNQLLDCPHSRFGIPICYLGFVAFSLVMLLDRLKKNFFPNDRSVGF